MGNQKKSEMMLHFKAECLINVRIYSLLYFIQHFFTNYVIFLKLCNPMLFEAKCAKSHHRIISEALQRAINQTKFCSSLLQEHSRKLQGSLSTRWRHRTVCCSSFELRKRFVNLTRFFKTWKREVKQGSFLGPLTEHVNLLSLIKPTGSGKLCLFKKLPFIFFITIMCLFFYFILFYFLTLNFLRYAHAYCVYRQLCFCQFLVHQ